MKAHLAKSGGFSCAGVAGAVNLLKLLMEHVCACAGGPASAEGSIALGLHAALFAVRNGIT